MRAFALVPLISVHVWTTSRHCPLAARPMVIHRSSVSLCSSSKVVTESGSRRTVAATMKDTPCFLTFASAFVPFDFEAEVAHPLTIRESRIAVKIWADLVERRQIA